MNQQRTNTAAKQNTVQKLPLTTPAIRRQGTVQTLAGQGGSANEYDSFSEKRSS